MIDVILILMAVGCFLFSVGAGIALLYQAFKK